MSTFTNSITSIVNSGYINTNYTSKQINQIAQSIKSGAIDTVSFSDESKNLFHIAQIDSSLNGIFGIPNDLDKTQKLELESFRSSLDATNPRNYSEHQQIDFDELFENLGLGEVDKQKVKNLTNELSQYITQRSIDGLFGNSSGGNLSFLSDGYTKILGEKLTEDDTTALGTLSVQLNRLLFDSEDSQISSYLNLFNDLYGLNNPSEEDIFNANSLLTQRNTLLSTALLDRSYQSAYTF